MKLKLLALSLALAGVQVTNAAQWDYPSAAITVTVTNQAEALRYLQANYASAGELKFRYQTRSKHEMVRRSR